MDSGEPSAPVCADGSVYVEAVQETRIREIALELLPDPVVGSDGFGLAVSIDGDRAIVGAPSDDEDGTYSGAAYVFERNADGDWAQKERLKSDAPVTGDTFGSSVAISGDWAFVGLHGSVMAAPDWRVEIFQRQPDGSWDRKQVIKKGEYRYGYSVAVNGDRAIVGSPSYSSEKGCAYVYERDATTDTWVSETRLLTTGGITSDNLGFSVAIDGDRAIAGADGRDENANQSGAAYIFERNPADGTWSQPIKLFADDGELRGLPRAERWDQRK